MVAANPLEAHNRQTTVCLDIRHHRNVLRMTVKSVSTLVIIIMIPFFTSKIQAKDYEKSKTEIVISKMLTRRRRNMKSRTGNSSSKLRSSGCSPGTDDDNDHKTKQRTEVEIGRAKPKSPSKMLFDSRTTSHMTNCSDCVQLQRGCDIIISLADDSTVKAT